MRNGRMSVPVALQRVAGLWVGLCLAATLARADGGVDLTGTWVLDDALSDDPAAVLRERSSPSGSGLGRAVVRDISVFGIPVGSLPLPTGNDDEPKDAEEVAGPAAYAVSAVERLEIAQDAAASTFDYGNATSVSYRHGVRQESDAGTALAEWRGGALEIEHRLRNGTRITETYELDDVQQLHWTVRFKERKGDGVVIERVYYRAKS